jgi:uncharacterized membrane protein YphA (DoxX/SURF4 family)
MSLIRFASRSLFAGYFVADGLQAILDPDSRVSQAEPLAEQVTQYAQRVLPPEVARRVPTRTETWVRVHGIAQTAGALMLATGVFRRVGAALVVAACVPKVLVASRSALTADRMAFLREVPLLGGALIAAQDTQGKPGLRWLASHRAADALQAGLVKVTPVAKAKPVKAKAIDGRTVRRQARALGHELAGAHN